MVSPVFRVRPLTKQKFFPLIYSCMHYKKTTIECFALSDIDEEGAAALHETDMRLSTHEGESIYAIEDVIAECDRRPCNLNISHLMTGIIKADDPILHISRLRDKLATIAIESLTPVKILM